MNERKSKRRVYAVLALILLLCNGLMVLVFMGKRDMHIDELWSYSLSNSYHKPFLFYWQAGTGEIGSESRNFKAEVDVFGYPESDPFLTDEANAFYEQWHDGEEFHQYLTVQKNERFDYENVYYNQVCDIHPPLYYFLLHTICSFFPDCFSIWYAAVLNLFFYSLSIIALFALGREVFRSDKKGLLAAAVWGLSRAGLSNAAFLRMYMIMTFLTILLAYFHVRLVRGGGLKYAIPIFVVNAAGFLTQYYFYIFSFFITAATCFYLLFKKRFKRLFPYALTVLASVGTALLIFPATIVHLTQGTYTSRTANKLSQLFLRPSNLFAYLFQDYTGLSYYEKTTFAELFPITAVLAVLAAWLWIGKKKPETKKRLLSALRHFDAGYAILLISMFLSGSLIGRILPDMAEFSDRYIFALLPLFSLPFVSLICLIAEKAAARFQREKVGFPAAAAVLMIFAVMSNTLNENRYFGETRNSAQVNQTVAAAADGGTFYYVADREFVVHIFSNLFLNAKRVYPAHRFDDSLAERINENEIGADHAYIIFEAADVFLMTGEVTTDKEWVAQEMQRTMKHDYTFITDFIYGNDSAGELYYLYRVDYV